VSIAAIRAMNPVGKACQVDGGGQAIIVDEVCPLLAQVCESRANVKDVMAQELLPFSVYCGKDAAIKHIVPLIKVLAKDEAFSVRNSIVKDLATIAEVVTPSVLVESLLPALTQLAKDPKWRVRMGVIDNIGMMAATLGLKMFEKNFQPTLIAALADHVSAIRECACAQVGSLVKEFGAAWAGTDFFPAALAMYDQGTNYLHRVTCLLIIESASTELDAVSINTHLLPVLVMACTDDVANVRISAAKCALVVLKKLDAATVSSKLKPLLTKLAKDADGDVAHFGALALKECK
jgi:serine/threonine-protein phosphatase 2A regulatory subunit A